MSNLLKLNLEEKVMIKIGKEYKISKRQSKNFNSDILISFILSHLFCPVMKFLANKVQISSEKYQK